MNKNNTFFLLFLLCFYSNGQNVIVKGEIENIDGMPVANVSVVAYIDQLIAGYGFSDDNGSYELNLKNLTNGSTLKLDLNCLGFRNFSREIIFRGDKELTQDFILTEKVEELNEVILEAWEKIKVNKDTVTFKAETFMNGSEQVVEDLLKNLPGVEVLNNGVIKVNGKTIDKLLIEGDDLFDEKYKLLSKNLDAKNISEVQILNDFEDNPILKSFQQSDKVALNLKLKEDKKNVWFGNTNIGLGINERYDGSANLGLLKKKFKFFNLFSLNNIQKLSLPQVREVSNQSTSDFQTEKRVEKSNNTLVNIDDLSGVNFSDNEDVFNDSFLNSLSLVTNLSENTKLRSLTYFGFDKVKRSNSNFIEYLVSPETIEYSEKKDITTKDLIFATELELKHYSKKKNIL